MKKDNKMNKTATDFIKGINAYCKSRNMSREGKLGYLKGLRKQLLTSEADQTDKLNNTHDKIAETDKWIKELEEEK